MNIPECIKRISPNWSKLLEEAKNFKDLTPVKITDNGEMLNIAQANCCIVGEAHVFSNRYYNMGCQTCTDFSMLFYDLTLANDKKDSWTDDQILSLSQYLGLSGMNEVQMLQAFCDHFDKEHKK